MGSKKELSWVQLCWLPLLCINLVVHSCDQIFFLKSRMYDGRISTAIVAVLIIWKCCHYSQDGISLFCLVVDIVRLSLEQLDG